MAESILMKSGMAGVDLDAVTAAAGDVLKGKVIVDQSGDPLTGTLALTGNIAAADIRKGKTGYSTNPKSKITGTMAEQAAQTITPGTANKTIAANRYLTGVQTVQGDKNLLAKNIIRGVTIFGVAGSAVYAGDIPGYFLEPPKEYEDLTGGWTLPDTNTVHSEKDITYYRVYTSESLYEDMTYLCRTAKVVDLSKYRKIYFDYDITIKDVITDTQYGLGTNCYLQLSASTKGVVVNSGADCGQTKIELVGLKEGTSKNFKGTISLDVSMENEIVTISTALRNGSASSGFRPMFSFDAKILAIRYDKIQ